MGFDNPIGKQVSQDDETYKIIGVVKDFHFKPVYRRIGPIMLFCNNPDRERIRYMFIRFNPGNISELITHLQEVTLKFNPDFPFEYHFLDDEFDSLYRGVEQMTNIIRTFAILAILISCLGLFGLAAFMAEQRTKEIGVRKVLGASIPNIIVLFSREFSRWIFIANIIAWPIAFYLMNKWLQDFAYRASLSWLIFFTSGVVVLILALLTVSYQALKAARTNPVNTLKYE